MPKETPKKRKDRLRSEAIYRNQIRRSRGIAPKWNDGKKKKDQDGNPDPSA